MHALVYYQWIPPIFQTATPMADADADADAEEQVLLADADATEADISDGFGDESEAGAEESEAVEDEDEADEADEADEDEVDVDGADEVMPKGLVGESDFEFEDEHGANKGPNVTAVLAVACLVFGSFTGFGAGIAAANAAAMANAPLAEPSPPPNCAQWKQPAKKAARLYVGHHPPPTVHLPPAAHPRLSPAARCPSPATHHPPVG